MEINKIYQNKTNPLKLSARNIVLISADYPKFISGIGDHSHILFNEISKRTNNKLLVTTNHKEILDNNSIIKIDWSIKELSQLVLLIKKNESYVLLQYPGILYGKYNLSIFFLVLVLRILKVNITIYLHEFSNLHSLRKSFMRFFFRYSSKIIVTTNDETRLVSTFFNKSRIFKIPIYPNITDSKNYSDYNSKTIVYFGMIYPDKGFENIIEICNQIDCLYKGKYKFRFLISYHPQFKEYFNESIALILKSTFKFEYFLNLDESEILPKLWNSFAALTYYNDGASIRRGSLLTMLSLGIPIFSNNGLGINEFEEILNKGLFIDYNKNFDFEENLHKIISNQAFYSNCSENLIKFSKKFSKEDLVNRIIDVVYK
ncbi:MAG: hypothetical protein CMF23_13230 [Ignavibacteriae bacterium]|nr:hypothetical protein [Ignavibacteriota bacterium]